MLRRISQMAFQPLGAICFWYYPLYNPMVVATLFRKQIVIKVQNMQVVLDVSISEISRQPLQPKRLLQDVMTEFVETREVPSVMSTKFNCLIS